MFVLREGVDSTGNSLMVEHSVGYVRKLASQPFKQLLSRPNDTAMHEEDWTAHPVECCVSGCTRTLRSTGLLCEHELGAMWEWDRAGCLKSFLNDFNVHRRYKVYDQTIAAVSGLAKDLAAVEELVHRTGRGFGVALGCGIDIQTLQELQTLAVRDTAAMTGGSGEDPINVDSDGSDLEGFEQELPADSTADPVYRTTGRPDLGRFVKLAEQLFNM